MELLADYQTLLDRIHNGPFAPLYQSNLMINFLCSTPEQFRNHFRRVTDSEEDAIQHARDFLRDSNYTLDKIEQAIILTDRAKQSAGGRARKKLAKDKHRKWLIEELANFKGQTAIYKKIAGEIFSKYKYKVSPKIVRKRAEELGLLEDA